MLDKDWMQIVDKTLSDLEEQLSQTEILYVNSRMWLVYESIVRVYARFAVLTGTSVEKSRYHDWKSDSLMLKHLGEVLSPDQIENAKDMTFGGLPNLVVELKAQFISECRSLVAGQKQLEESVSKIGQILRRQVDKPNRKDFGL